MHEQAVVGDGEIAAQTVSSANPGSIARELMELDRRIGWLVVNRFTYPFIRLLGRTAKPSVDASRVSISSLDKSFVPGIMVDPLQRSGDGAVLLFHGGGFVIGRPEDLLAKAVVFATQLGVPVICPRYRLAPEAPYPAALDDCRAAWSQLLGRAEAMAIDPHKIVIGGFSAGGGLAASLVQKLRDKGGVQPAAQLLVYPMLDDRTAAWRALDKPRHRVWSNRNNRFAWTSYLGRAPENDCPRYAAAARCEDLAGLPPAWIGVGTCDLFLDENRVYAHRLSAAGVPTIYLEVEGAIHGFDMHENALGTAFTESQLAFAARYLR
ncbi:alpha/beta hydrolase [Leptolyngbya sp. 15MV]|nr:alpha/beta hydrolase [Leptolyngbya sp. 15MV]